MRVAWEPLNRQRAHDTVAMKKSLDERDPALINLPIPIPSIPIVAPLITKLVAGKTKPATTSTSPSPPASTPTSGGSDSGDSGGSGSGDDGGSDSGGTGGGGSGSGGSGGSGNSSDGSVPGESSPGSNGGSGANGGSSGGDSGSSSGDSSPSGGLAADLSSQSGSVADGAADGASGTSSGVTPGNTLLANAGAPPPGGSGSQSNASNGIDPLAGSPSTIYSNGVPVSTVSARPPGSTGGPTGTDGNGNGNGGGGGSGATDANGRHGMSKGVVAAIAVTVSLVFLIVIVGFLRKRSIARRTERRKRWWFGRSNLSDNFDRGSVAATAGSFDNVSVRSSFGTSYDHSLPKHLSNDNIPPLPPMAEVHDAHAPGLTMHGQKNDMLQSPVLPLGVRGTSPLLLSFDEHNLTSDPNDRRASGQSNESTSSDPNYQYLFVKPSSSSIGASPAVDDSLPTPMSVRPFSPSESFAFPKPPNSDRDSVYSAYSRRASANSSGVLAKSPIAEVPPTPALPALIFDAALKSPSEPDSANPFLDPVAQPEQSPAAIETIRRPFNPTLHDELGVAVGDQVRVSQIFDDGWALVEKPSADGKGKAKQVQGLIPVDCLRDVGQGLPAFAVTKRVSSYSAVAYAV